MIKYEITVFITSDYKTNESFIFETDGDVQDFKGRGRLEIIEEVNKRYKDWYSFDIINV